MRSLPDIPKLRVLDLFSGIGGFSLGLERTGGFETVAFCEIEEFCQRVLNKHWPSVPVFPDVRLLTNARLIAARIFADLICAGFPCQDLSLAGGLKGLEGERSGLWSEIVRLVGEIGPKYLLLENVANILAGERGAWHGRVLSDLAACGYDAEWGCLPASSFGMPHARDRWWLMAYPTGQGRPGLLHRFFAERQEQSFQLKTKALDTSRHLDARARGEVDGEPPLFRGNDGRANRVDRLKAVGNGIAPIIPETLGHAILEAERQAA